MNLRATIQAAQTSGPISGADGSASVEYRFGADEPVFQGHFPGHPLLPGIFQVEMTRVAAEAALGCALDIGEVTKAKFISPILPDETVRVDLKWSGQAADLQVSARIGVTERKAGEVILQLVRKS